MIAATNPAAYAGHSTDEVAHTVIGDVRYQNLSAWHLTDDAQVQLAINAAVAQHCESFHKKTQHELSAKAKRFAAHAEPMRGGWYSYKVNRIGGKEPYVCTVALCKQDKGLYAQVSYIK